MANCIKLGNRPKNFKRVVEFDMLDGTKGAIEWSFKYRTRSEFGKFIDDIFSAAKEEQPADGDFKMADLMDKTKGKNAAYILDMADGWNLEEPFNLSSIEQLCDELPAAASAAMDDYRLCTVEGRVKN